MDLNPTWGSIYIPKKPFNLLVDFYLKIAMNLNGLKDKTETTDLLERLSCLTSCRLLSSCSSSLDSVESGADSSVSDSDSELDELLLDELLELESDAMPLRFLRLTPSATRAISGRCF